MTFSRAQAPGFIRGEDVKFNFQHPHPLMLLLPRVYYKGWGFEVCHTDPSIGLRGMAFLIVRARVQDAVTGNLNFEVMHEFVVPAVFMDDVGWGRWLIERIVLVEQHEACEFFWVDGQRPFFPEHGEKANPYRIVDRRRP